MPLKSLKNFTDLLVLLQDAYGELETEYGLQRAMLHEKHTENARLRKALQQIDDLDKKMDNPHDIADHADAIAQMALRPMAD